MDSESIKSSKTQNYKHQTKYGQKVSGWRYSWLSHVNYLSGEKII